MTILVPVQWEKRRKMSCTFLSEFFGSYLALLTADRRKEDNPYLVVQVITINVSNLKSDQIALLFSLDSTSHKTLKTIKLQSVPLKTTRWKRFKCIK